MSKVVDKALCTISSPYEQIVSLNKDHLHLCEMLDDSFKDHNPILHWLRSVAGNSRQNVTERIAACKSLLAEQIIILLGPC